MAAVVPVIARQIVIMAFLMLIGFICYSTHMIDDHGARQMSDLVLYVANPAIVMRSLMRPFDPKILVQGAWVALLTILIFFVTLLLGRIAYPNRKERYSAVSRFSILFSNSGFIGIPLVKAVLGDEYVFYVALANTIATFAIWTYGVWLISDDRTNIAPKKVLTNPAIIGVCIGLVFFFLSLPVPDLLGDIIDDVAGMNLGLVMIVLGAYLAECDLKTCFKDPELYKACFWRLIAAPLATILLLVPFGWLSAGIKVTLLIYIATPAAAVTSLFAHQFGKEGNFATTLVAVSTLFSLATMPLVILLASLVL